MDFKKVLVIGGTSAGKTSLLTHIVSGQCEETYTPTRHAQSFYDCSRGIEFIDTAGLSDVFGEDTLSDEGEVDSSQTSTYRLEHLWEVFIEDQQVQTLFGISDTSSSSISSTPPTSSRSSRKKKRQAGELNVKDIKAYLVLYHDERSEQIAKALWYAAKLFGKKIFAVNNIQASLPSSSDATPSSYPSSTLKRQYHKKSDWKGPTGDELKNVFYPQSHFPYFRRGLDESDEKLSEQNQNQVYLGEICFVTGEGISDMLETLAASLNSSLDYSVERRSSKHSRGTCGINGPECCIS